MRLRQVVAAFLAVALASPAWAAPTWYRTGVTGPTWTDAQFNVCDSTHLAGVNRAATSKTNAVTMVTWASGIPSVNTVDGPTTTNTFGQPRGLGCGASRLTVTGGKITGTGATYWIYNSSSLSSISWSQVTDQTDGAGTAIDNLFGNIDVSPPGAKDVIVANYWNHSSQSRMSIGTIALSPYSTAYSSEYNSGGNNFGTECTTAKVGSGYVYAACAGNSKIYSYGWQGTTSSNLFAGNATCTGPATANAIMRPGFTDGTLGVAIASNGTDSYVCGMTSAGSATVNQTLSSILLKSGANFASGLWAWQSTGLSRKFATSTFDLDSTYDIPSDVLNGSTVVQVVAGIDADGDGDATNNLVGYLADGSIIYYGQHTGTVTTTLTSLASKIVSGSGDSTQLTWSSTNADSCAKSGSWSGSGLATASSSNVTPSATSTYTITCSNSTSSAAASSTVSVIFPSAGGRQPPSLSGSL